MGNKRNWASYVAGGARVAANIARGVNFNYNRNSTTTHRYAGGDSNGGVKFSRERHMMGRRKRRNYVKMDDLMRGYAKVRTRWQMTSPTLIGPGRLPISYGIDTTSQATFETLPVHMMSLSMNPYGLSSEEKGCHKRGLFRLVRNSTDGSVGWNWFESQLPKGVNDYNIDGEWEFENREALTAKPASMYHKWTEVKMNLYGAKYIPLTYTISFVQMPKEYDPFQIGSWVPLSSNLLPIQNEFTRFTEDLVRLLISNPINVGGTKAHWKNNIRILKQYKIDMAPLSYVNATAEGTADVHVGNVRQFKTFIRHDRWRNYQWSDILPDTVTDLSYQDLGWDVSQKAGLFCDVEWGKRVFLMVTCSTGPRIDHPMFSVYNHKPAEITSMPGFSGTYDIMVRNEYMFDGQPA